MNLNNEYKMAFLSSIKRFFKNLFSSPINQREPDPDAVKPPEVSVKTPEIDIKGKEENYLAELKPTGEIIDPEPKKKEVQKLGITQSAYKKAANLIGCESETNAIKAVAHVESRGSGFLSDGRPKILFEAHWFSKLTNGQYNSSHPSISSRSWDRSLYIGGAGEHRRLEKAMKLNRNAALQSCSWGKFQIMGFNFKDSGYGTVQEFVNAMWRSESDHLLAFTNFVNSKGISRDICRKNWSNVAYKYNGPGYKKNNWHNKMQAAYNKLENGEKLV